MHKEWKTYFSVCTLTQNGGIGTGQVQVTSGFHALFMSVSTKFNSELLKTSLWLCVDTSADCHRHGDSVKDPQHTWEGGERVAALIRRCSQLHQPAALRTHTQAKTGAIDLRPSDQDHAADHRETTVNKHVNGKINTLWGIWPVMLQF